MMNIRKSKNLLDTNCKYSEFIVNGVTYSSNLGSQLVGITKEQYCEYLQQKETIEYLQAFLYQLGYSTRRNGNNIQIEKFIEFTPYQEYKKRKR